jgi:hypothetical protein
MKRIGVIKTVEDNVVTLIGFGEFRGNKLVDNDELGIEIEVPVFKLDSGTVMENSYGYFWASEESIKNDIKLYEDNGYIINSLDL